jgi:hypothetical protein
MIRIKTSRPGRLLTKRRAGYVTLPLGRCAKFRRDKRSMSTMRIWLERSVRSTPRMVVSIATCPGSKTLFHAPNSLTTKSGFGTTDRVNRRVARTDPGRCPGLSCDWPFGPKFKMHRLHFAAPKGHRQNSPGQRPGGPKHSKNPPCKGRTSAIVSVRRIPLAPDRQARAAPSSR